MSREKLLVECPPESFQASSSIKFRPVLGENGQARRGNRIFTNSTSLNKLKTENSIFSTFLPSQRKRYDRRWGWKSGWIMKKMMWRRGHQWPVEDKRIIVFILYFYPCHFLSPPHPPRTTTNRWWWWPSFPCRCSTAGSECVQNNRSRWALV